MFLFFFISVSFFTKAQESNTYKLIAGARVNPLVIYDFDGNRTETVRLHGEIGMMWNKKWYFSAGYTPFLNSFYTFNEYWFRGMDKKLPVSLVASAEYMPDNDTFILQGGPNFKLKGGNIFGFLFTPTGNFNLGMKLGAFIPLNIIIKKK